MKNRFSALGQFWFILKFSGKYFWDTDKKIFLATIFTNSITSLVIIPNLIIDKTFLDTLINNYGKPLTPAVIRLVIILVLARLGLALLRTGANTLSGYYARYFFWKNFQRAEVMIGQKYATISVPTLEDPRFKDRYQKIEREGISRLQRIGENYVRLPQHITGIVSSLSIFALTEPWVILVSVLSLIPTVIVERWFIKKDYELDTSVMTLHRRRNIYSYYLSRARSYLELRVLNIHRYLAHKVHSVWEDIIARRIQLQKSHRSFSFMAGIVDNSATYSFDAVFGIQALMSKITIGTAQAYIRAIATFKQSVSDLTSAILEMYENYLYLEDLVWFLNLENPYFNDSGIKLTDPITSVSFKNISFKYPGTDHLVLKDVSFDISPRENIALIGKNGAGKTTLVKLLLGFYVPSGGRVLVNGISVTDLNKPAYWKKLSALFQESEPFGLTINELLSIGDISRSTDQHAIRKMAEVTQIDDWIDSLPLKYDNPIGRDFEHGVSPSTGQWQKLMISRTLFKDADLLLLDEPTSNVDPEAEENIFKEILSLDRDKIIIFISHRFSTVRQADRILVLEDGRITEQGSHTELMKLKGTYARLFTLQAKSYR